MKLKVICAAVLALVTFLSVNAKENIKGKTEFEMELKRKVANVHTITSDFVQKQYISILAKPVEKKGSFYYKDPDQILLKFHDGDYISMTASLFRMKNAGKVTKIKVGSNPMLHELRSILSACMKGDVLDITNKFSYTLAEKGATYTVVMKPRKKGRMKLKQILLEFDKKDMCLSKMIITQPNEDYILYEFFNKKINATVDSRMFNVEK